MLIVIEWIMGEIRSSSWYPWVGMIPCGEDPINVGAIISTIWQFLIPPLGKQNDTCLHLDEATIERLQKMPQINNIMKRTVMNANITGGEQDDEEKDQAMLLPKKKKETIRCYYWRPVYFFPLPP